MYRVHKEAGCRSLPTVTHKSFRKFRRPDQGALRGPLPALEYVSERSRNITASLCPKPAECENRHSSSPARSWFPELDAGVYNGGGKCGGGISYPRSISCAVWYYVRTVSALIRVWRVTFVADGAGPAFFRQAVYNVPRLPDVATRNRSAGRAVMIGAGQVVPAGKAEMGIGIARHQSQTTIAAMMQAMRRMAAYSKRSGISSGRSVIWLLSQ